MPPPPPVRFPPPEPPSALPLLILKPLMDTSPLVSMKKGRKFPSPLMVKDADPGPVIVTGLVIRSNGEVFIFSVPVAVITMEFVASVDSFKSSIARLREPLPLLLVFVTV